MKMTREEFYRKYGDVDVRFGHYYKFTFTFVGVRLDGTRVIVSFGGNADDIYRTAITWEEVRKLNDIDAYSGGAYDENDAEIDSFYNSF